MRLHQLSLFYLYILFVYLDSVFKHLNVTLVRHGVPVVALHVVRSWLARGLHNWWNNFFQLIDNNLFHPALYIVHIYFVVHSFQLFDFHNLKLKCLLKDHIINL